MTETTDAPTTGKRRATFNTLEVSELRRLTDDSVQVTFAVPEELDGAEVRRSYSICAVPKRGEIRVAVKKDIGGRFSTWANESLEVGEKIDVMNPQGAFTSRT
ncbi:phenylacetate-CoA oxygenase/reductase subunit PaaK, partial [Xanthomonas citri pv. citri]|nr:phenylacetate-CoA oxygenase/reductase subunit PaaK [Xanthomonas citri pv. citri]